MLAAKDDIHDLLRHLRSLHTAGPEEWAAADLTFRQLRALFVLRARQPLRVSDLADALHMSLASASALADRLSKLGHIVRERDATDRRTVLLRLSSKASRMLGEMERRGSERLSVAVAKMTPAERAALRATLRAFVRIAEAKRTGAAARHDIRDVRAVSDRRVLPERSEARAGC